MGDLPGRPAGENSRPVLGFKSDGIAQFRAADHTFAGRGEARRRSAGIADRPDQTSLPY